MRGGARKKLPVTTVAVLSAVAMVAAACSSSGGSASSTSGGSNAASAPGISKNQIIVGLDTSLTGPAAANFNGAQQGVQARFALQNDQGGVNGRKLKLVVADDESSPTQAQTAVNSLIQTHNAFGLIFISDLVSSAYRLPQQQGVPVIGAPIDGPEWGQQPNTNMVAVTGNQSANLPTYTTIPKAMKIAGASNVASLAIANEAPSVIGAQLFVKAAQKVGLKVGYENYSIPIGTVDVGPVVLAMKQANVDGFASYMLNTTDFAIMEGAKQSGLQLKAPFDFTSYTQDLLDNQSALQAAQGIVVQVIQTPVEEHTKATEAEQAAFKKYENFSGVPNLNWSYGWLSADLFIQGLEHAGKNPTRSSFLSAVRGLKGWTANGLMPKAPDFSLSTFGKSPSTSCDYYVQLKGSKYVTLNNGKPICGELIPS